MAALFFGVGAVSRLAELVWAPTIRLRSAVPLPSFSSRIAGALAAGLLLAGGASSAHDSSAGEDQVKRLGFGQFVHRRWTASDGAPLGIRAINQTPDGYLWLGSTQGLYRFDGVTFERIPGPPGSPMERAGVTALHVTRSGTLWVGFSQYGGAGVVRGGRLYDMQLPDPEENITLIADTTDGAVWAVWAGFGSRFQRFVKGRWERIGDRFGLQKDAGLTQLCGTSDGRLWAALSLWDNSAQLTYLPPGAHRFKPSRHHISKPVGIILDPKGQPWLISSDPMQLLDDRIGPSLAKDNPFPQGPCRENIATFDRDGRRWGIASGRIFYSAGPQPAPKKDRILFGLSDGLSSAKANVVAADSEGSVWVGTAQGLDQFITAKAFQEPIKLNGQWSIARTTDGTIYIGGSRETYQIAPDGRPRKIAGDSGDALCAGRDNDMWFFKGANLLHFNGRFQTSKGPANGSTVVMCAEDKAGRLWVTLDDSRVGWRDARGWHITNFRSEWWDLAITAEGDLAFKTMTDLVRIRGDKPVTTRLAKYDAGAFSLIRAGTRDIFLSGSRALLRVRGDQVARLDGERFPWVTQLRDLVQTPAGETWLVGEDGLSRVSTTALDRAFDSPGSTLQRTLFNMDDGIDSPTQTYFRRGHHAEVGGDGRIWFLNELGASFIVPERLQTNPIEPPVAIRALTSAGHTYVDPRNITLRAGTRSIDIAYTALSLVVPSRVQFRYQLEGVDDGWINPGTRRTASYSNLGPGTYRFRVIASNNDGVWNRTGATLEFKILPTFFQSWPFYLLCGLLALGLLWLAYSLRLRAVARRIQARMNERLDERERIARELHDTLLQSVQGLIMRFGNIAQDIPAISPAHREMLDVLDSADAVVIEGRDRVHELRRWSDSRSLSEVISTTAGRLLPPVQIESRVVVEGSPREVYPGIADEILRIIDEALFNVSRHAQAHKVTILIVYGAQALVVRIIDDGVGIDPKIAASGELAGHFGLVGMHERANRIGAQLAIVGATNGGTQVEVKINAQLAYADKPRSLWMAWWHRRVMDRRNA